MRAPKGHTNQPTRKLSTYVAPYQEEWIRTEAARRHPDRVGEPVARGPVSRFLRDLVAAEWELNRPDRNRRAELTELAHTVRVAVDQGLQQHVPPGSALELLVCRMLELAYGLPEPDRGGTDAP